jgi:hypothetical protein
MVERFVTTDGDDCDSWIYRGDEHRCRSLTRSMVADLDGICVEFAAARSGKSLRG